MLTIIYNLGGDNMKSKLMKILSVSLIICVLAVTVVTTVNEPDVPGSYGQAMPVSNQIISNI